MNNKKLKIAVQLFGHLRTFQECSPYLKKNILDRYDCDVFVHTWDSLDHTDSTWHNFKKVNFNCSIEDEKRLIISNYSPKKFIVEKQEKIIEGYYGKNYFKKISLNGIKNMLYSLCCSNYLREYYQYENRCKYDFVIVLRPDILINEAFDVSRYLNVISDKTIVHFYKTLNINCTNGLLLVTPLASDCLYFGRPKAISAAARVICNFKRFYIDFPATLPSEFSHVEHSFLEYLCCQDIRSYFYKIDFWIKRDKPNRIGKILEKQFDRIFRMVPVYFKEKIANTLFKIYIFLVQ